MVSRRRFLQTTFISLSALPFAGQFLNLPSAVAAEEKLPMAKETEEPAKSLKFCANADKPSKNCEARKAKEKKDQYCYNCQLFQQPVGEKKAAVGKCLIIPKKTVPGAGWCQSWVKNPAIKA
jgi:hypothetical protein